MSEDETTSANRMSVIARVRPLASSESRPVVYVKDSTIGVNLDAEVTATKSSKEYSLDKVYGEDIGQEEVFEGVQPLMRAALSGFNTTVFTYGQTGTGKTHTMLGHDLWEMASENAQDESADDRSRASSYRALNRDREARGIIPRALHYVFKQIRVMVEHSSPSHASKHPGSDNNVSEKNNSITVSVSYTEIYNERVRDLLAVQAAENTNITVQGIGAAALTPSKGGGGSYFGIKEQDEKSLDIREDKKLGIVIPNLTEVLVETEEEVFNVLWKGARNRAMASTNMNERSSRSHTIFGVRLTVALGGVVRRSKINLVDLAGSERYKTHQMARFSEQRIKELTSINQSLSALGNCISALTKRGGTKQHVPYRNSKLTRLLQDSLGGNTRTMFIVTVSPSAISADETVSTLQFADRAMRVRVFATSNEILSDDDPLKRAHHEIARLKSLLQASISRQKLTKGGDGGGDSNKGDDRGGKGDSRSDSGGNKSNYNNNRNMNMQMQMVEKMDAEAQAEAAALRDENLKLAEEVSRLREALVREKNEKAKLLKAIYKGEGNEDHEEVLQHEIDVVFGVGDDNGNIALDSDSASGSSTQIAKVDHMAQLRVLLAQRSMLEQRQEEIEATQRDQDEQREWLDHYHTWLRNLPVSENHETSSEGEPLTLYDRLCMMETSVLLQSQELKRTKRLFLRDKDRLERQISEGLQNIEERDILYSQQTKELENQGSENESLKIELDDMKVNYAKLKLESMKLSSSTSSERKVEFHPQSSIRHSDSTNSVITDSPTKTKTESKGDFRFNDEINGVTRGNGVGGSVSTANLDRLKQSGGRVRRRTSSSDDMKAKGKVNTATVVTKKKTNPWTKHLDPTHNVYYYHNSVTQETTWETPSDFVE